MLFQILVSPGVITLLISIAQKKSTLNVNPPKRRCNKLANFLQCENLSRGAQTATLQNST